MPPKNKKPSTKSEKDLFHAPKRKVWMKPKIFDELFQCLTALSGRIDERLKKTNDPEQRTYLEGRKSGLITAISEASCFDKRMNNIITDALSGKKK